MAIGDLVVDAAAGQVTFAVTLNKRRSNNVLS
jgi:hypothetical protein